MKRMVVEDAERMAEGIQRPPELLGKALRSPHL